MVKNRFDRKMDNRGSALLTVILVVGFLTILATTLLYVSGMNFQIKQADYQNKKNFYTGETALEEIRANLMVDASAAAIDAYSDITMQFVTLGSREMRQLEYNKAFVQKLQERLVPPVTGIDDWQTILRARFTPGAGPTPPYKLELDHTYDLNGDGIFTTAEVVEVHDVDGYIRIKGLKMTYIDPDTKLTTILSTDLDVRAPGIDWSTEMTTMDLADGSHDGITPQMAAESRTDVDASQCVKYANWKKE